jgi:hypothetical protein
MMKNRFPYITMLVFTIIFTSCRQKAGQCVVSGELKKWHTLTLTLTGPMVHELDTPNPFLDYRLNVSFKHENGEYLVPGFYATDGSAVHSGTSKGNIWQVRFVPDSEGQWEYSVSFRKGKNIAISDDPYENFVVIHTHSNPKYRYRIFDQLTGYACLDGPSMQIGNLMNAHEETLVWLEKSSIAGRQWVVNIDEIGPASRGIDPGTGY